MARESKTTKSEAAKKETVKKEFSYDGKEFKWTGVLWSDFKKSSEWADRTPMSLTINGVITIKGCKLIQTDKDCFISWPQYQKKDGNYDSFVYAPKEFNEELEAVAKAAEKALG